MYKSLYSILAPLVSKKKNGILSLFHENGEGGTIIIKNGSIIGLETGELQGAKAGSKLAMWLCFQKEFTENMAISHKKLKGINTDKYLSFLARVEKGVFEIQKVVSLNGNSFKFNAQDLVGSKEFKPNELKVALALDGKTPIKEIIAKTGLSDLLVLSNIYKLNNLGLLKAPQKKDRLEKARGAFFLESITGTLAEYVGPAAKYILIEAFEQLDSTPDNIYKSELPQLVNNISTHLDPNDRLSFKKKGRESIRSYKNGKVLQQGASFLESMTATLADYVGPSAEFILIEAFKHLESTPDFIHKNELPQLTNTISYHLDEDDRLPFKKRAMEFIRNHKGIEGSL